MSIVDPTVAARMLCRRVLAIAWALAAAAALAAGLLGSLAAAASIGAGALLASASFLALVWIVVRSLPGASSSPARRYPRAILLLGLLKLALIGGAIWWLLTRGLIDPLAFLAGFTTIVVALLVAGFFSRPARAGA
jgi:ATP synthase I chain